MIPARAFWFLRHGETDWNADGRSQGRTDVPLNPTGVAQAASAAQLLRGRGIASIVSSPLSRARDTAEAAGKVLGLPVTLIDDLQEVSFGGARGHHPARRLVHRLDQRRGRPPKTPKASPNSARAPPRA